MLELFNVNVNKGNTVILKLFYWNMMHANPSIVQRQSELNAYSDTDLKNLYAASLETCYDMNNIPKWKICN